MRLGVLLPTFRTTPSEALEAAAVAAGEGLDGVFAYDHLWPMGSPERPAIAPFEVLATIATVTPGLVVGPLVARVGLVDDEVLLSQCRALRVAADGRVVIALGTGDKLSRDENVAYGVGVQAPGQRRASLQAIATALHDEGTEVWIGSGASATREIAVAVGCTLNAWEATPEDLATLATRSTVSWAGPARSRDGAFEPEGTRVLLEALAAAGATWAVFSPQTPIAALAALRR